MDQAHLLLAYDPRPNPYHYYALGESFFYLPGGHVEFQESASEALIREMQEETGHLVTVDRLIGAQEHAWMGDPVCCHTHEINFVFRMHSTTLKFGVIPDTRESHVAFAWVPMDQWASVDMRPVALKAMISQEGPMCFLSNLFSDSKMP